MQLMEHSMDIPSIEIIQTYAMGTRLNKAIKVDSSMDFSLNRIIK
jgi:hypothetical protein